MDGIIHTGNYHCRFVKTCLVLFIFPKFMFAQKWGFVYKFTFFSQGNSHHSPSIHIQEDGDMDSSSDFGEEELECLDRQIGKKNNKFWAEKVFLLPGTISGQ